MRRLLTVIAGIILCTAVYAQALVEEPAVPSEETDSTVRDTTVFARLEGDVIINQSEEIRSLVISHVYDGANSDRDAYRSQKSRKGTLFRIRIYSDSSQNARNESLRVMTRFQELYPETSVYRNFKSPFFNVTAGDYHTRGEADAALARIRGSFQKAFIVME